jgi:hypothetical protein
MTDIMFALTADDARDRLAAFYDLPVIGANRTPRMIEPA